MKQVGHDELCVAIDVQEELALRQGHGDVQVPTLLGRVLGCLTRDVLKDRCNLVGKVGHDVTYISCAKESRVS